MDSLAKVMPLKTLIAIALNIYCVRKSFQNFFCSWWQCTPSPIPKLCLGYALTVLSIFWHNFLLPRVPLGFTLKYLSHQFQAGSSGNGPLHNVFNLFNQKKRLLLSHIFMLSVRNMAEVDSKKLAGVNLNLVLSYFLHINHVGANLCTGHISITLFIISIPNQLETLPLPWQLFW